jgi:hypothetical protein
MWFAPLTSWWHDPRGAAAGRSNPHPSPVNQGRGCACAEGKRPPSPASSTAWPLAAWPLGGLSWPTTDTLADTLDAFPVSPRCPRGLAQPSGQRRARPGREDPTPRPVSPNGTRRGLLLTRRRSFGVEGPGRASMMSSSRRSPGSRGTTLTVCSSRSATCHRRSSRRRSTIVSGMRLRWRYSRNGVSGKSGAIHRSLVRPRWRACPLGAVVLATPCCNQLYMIDPEDKRGRRGGVGMSCLRRRIARSLQTGSGARDELWLIWCPLRPFPVSMLRRTQAA